MWWPTGEPFDPPDPFVPDRPTGRHESLEPLMRNRFRRAQGRALVASVVTAVVAAVALTVVSAGAANAAGPRLMLRALVVDDGTLWAKAMRDQFTVEGVPFTTVTLSDPARPQLTADFLATGSTARFNAVVLPDDQPAGLSAAERAALAAFEKAFGVRQVDMYTFANPTVGLNFAQNPGYIGDLTGMTATVTAAAKADGFGYLAGTVPIGVGSYGYLATPAGAGVMPAGGSFTPLVTVPIPGTTTAGSLLGVYANDGVEKLVVTAAMSSTLSHFRALAHGIVSWVTRGVHLGHNRNYMTFHYDDTFSYDARWDMQNNCTPTEDCPTTVTTTTDPIRMTPADVTAVVGWQRAQGYTVTMPFNAYHTQFDANGVAWPTPDPLTTAFVANKAEFRWLNHGYRHIFQGCVQDFTVVPWQCSTTDGLLANASSSNVAWVPRADISAEITDNITRGRALGLNFDAAEYLSGEHSGLFLLPKQRIDNPNFTAAVTAAGLRYIGADASREPGARRVGSATTVPRYPVAVYYNASTEAENVDEYNWFYTTRAQGGSGYCEDNPATATCLAAPLTPAGFRSYIVPTDAANDVRLIMSNDPRPFYAHVSNLTGPDYLGLTLMAEILRQYRTVMAANAPVVNLTLTQASDVLTKQQAWAGAGMSANPAVTAYLEGGQVTVVNPTTTAAPLTVPAWATVNGAAFGTEYGGERSGWVTGSSTVAVSNLRFTSPATATLVAGAAGSFTVAAASTEGTPRLTLAGTLPAGLAFTDNGNGTATIAGTPTVAGSAAVTVTASTALSQVTQALTVTVTTAPVFTSATSARIAVGRPATFTVTTTGVPAATVTVTGSLPSGLRFTSGAAGTATLAGTPSTLATLRDYPLTFTATSPAGRSTQAFVLTLGRAPAFTSGSTETATAGGSFTHGIRTSGSPAPTLTVTGLPAGAVFTPGATAGTGTIGGRVSTGGLYPITVTAMNPFGTATQVVQLTVRQAPAFTSAATATAVRGQPVSIRVAASGYPAPTLTRWSLLPLGLSWRANGDGSATISGTPLLRGTSSVLVTAGNAAGTVSQTLRITVS